MYCHPVCTLLYSTLSPQTNLVSRSFHSQNKKYHPVDNSSNGLEHHESLEVNLTKVNDITAEFYIDKKPTLNLHSKQTAKRMGQSKLDIFFKFIILEFI